MELSEFLTLQTEIKQECKERLLKRTEGEVFLCIYNGSESGAKLQDIKKRAINLSPRTIELSLDRLKRKGLIKEKQRTYYLTGPGKEVIQACEERLGNYG